MLQIDARLFKDPSGDFKDHNGIRPEIIARMVASKPFPDWLAIVHHEFALPPRRLGRPLRLQFSYAGARVLPLRQASSSRRV